MDPQVDGAVSTYVVRVPLCQGWWQGYLATFVLLERVSLHFRQIGFAKCLNP